MFATWSASMMFLRVTSEMCILLLPCRLDAHDLLEDQQCSLVVRG
jgi:hypothetical protein